MKCLLVICSLLMTSTLNTAFGTLRLDQSLTKLIHCFKTQMRNGFPKLGINRLEPYIKDFYQFDLSNYGVNFKGNLTDLTVINHSEFDLNELTYSIEDMQLNIDVTFNYIEVYSNYSASGGFNGLSLQLCGTGDFGIDISNLRLNGSLNLRPTATNGLQIWRFKINAEAGEMHSMTTGVMNSQFFTNFFNNWVENFLATLLVHSQDVVGTLIESLVVPPANNYLKDVSILELFVMVFGFVAHSENLANCNV